MFNVFRSSRSEVFCKRGALRNFPKFTGKHFFTYSTLGGCFCCTERQQLRTMSTYVEGRYSPMEKVLQMYHQQKLR